MVPRSWSRLLHFHSLRKPKKPPIPQLFRQVSTFPRFPTAQTSPFSNSSTTFFCTAAGYSNRVVQDLLADLEREKQQEREARKRAGLDTKDIDEEDNEDYMGVGPLIEKLEKERLKPVVGVLQYPSINVLKPMMSLQIPPPTKLPITHSPYLTNPILQ